MPTIPSIHPQAAKSSGPASDSNAVQQPITEENRPFTVDQFEGAWAGLKNILKDEPRLMAILAEFKPVLIDEEHCVLTLANPFQVNDFKKVGKQVMDHIRKTLHNHKLQLSLKSADHEYKRPAYTQEEKYKVLLEKNPELANLKSTLNLLLE